MVCTRRELVELRRAQHEARRIAAAKNRRRLAEDVERAALFASCGTDLVRILLEHLEGGSFEVVGPKIQEFVRHHLKMWGIDSEKMRQEVGAIVRWRSLNPMYDHLKDLIENNKSRGDRDACISFWNLVIDELKVQLLPITEGAGISPRALGEPDFIFEHQIKRSFP